MDITYLENIEVFQFQYLIIGIAFLVSLSLFFIKNKNLFIIMASISFIMVLVGFSYIGYDDIRKYNKGFELFDAEFDKQLGEYDLGVSTKELYPITLDLMKKDRNGTLKEDEKEFQIKFDSGFWIVCKYERERLRFYLYNEEDNRGRKINQIKQISLEEFEDFKKKYFQ